jgi:hypothetical protein
VASDIPGKASPPVDPNDLTPGERVAIVFRPSPRALKEKRVTVGVGDKRPRADIYLVCPAARAGVAALKAPEKGTIEDLASAWLGPRREYEIRAAGASDLTSPLPMGAEWVAVFDCPAGVSASYVAIEGQHYPFSSHAPAGLSAVPHAETTMASAALAMIAADPLERWRAVLASPDVGKPDEGNGNFAGALILSPLADRRARDAQAAIGRLEPEMARSVQLRMASVIDLGDEVSMPIWPGDRGAARTLIRDLLETAEAPRRALMAQAWLQQQPTAGAVIVDDAAAIDPRTGLTFPSVLLVNFTDGPVAASATRGMVVKAGSREGEAVQPDLLRIEPLTAMTATVGANQAITSPDDKAVKAARRGGSASDRRTVADIRIGEWAAERAVVGEIAHCRPPGLSIGPLMADWTEATFLKAAMDQTSNAPMPAAVSDRAVAGRLMFENGRWVVYFEIGNPAAPSAGVPELMLYFGPRGPSGRGILRVQPDGTLVDLRGGAGVPAGTATVVRAKDRTSYWIPVPASAIEPGRALRLGLVFVDGGGKRSAWPRPMLPWQTEPGRVAVDLNSWGPG